MYTIKPKCLFPYNEILIFHHIWILHKHTETQTLIFCLILPFKFLERQVYPCIFDFFCFYFFIYFYLSLCFLTFSIAFPKNALFINLRKPFSKFFFYFFFLNLYSYQYMILNLTILCNFFKNNPWFNACFNFLWVSHIQFYYAT